MRLMFTGDNLEIRMQGMERVWCLRSWIIIPRDYIETIKWHKNYEGKRPVWRVAGTGAPGILYAGYFRGHGKTQFLYIKQPKGLARFKARNVLEINTKNFRFNRLLLSLTPAQASRIQKWWKSV